MSCQRDQTNTFYLQPADTVQGKVVLCSGYGTGSVGGQGLPAVMSKA